MSRPDQVLGFRVVGLRFSSSSSSSHHQLLWKQHTVRTHTEAKPPDRTLFVVNVPPYCTQESFQHLFSQFGKVRQVFFHKRPTAAAPPRPAHPHFSAPTTIKGFKVAYVVFSHPAGLREVLGLAAGTVLTLASEGLPLLTGLKKWREEYNMSFVSRHSLGEEVKAVMADYDKRKERERLRGKMGEEPDDEGWVTVTSEKKKKPHMEKIDEVQKKRKSKRKKKKQELVNFYSFHQRQAKMDHLAQLRKKFEEDKKRIAQMRATRKFRPY